MSTLNNILADKFNPSSWLGWNAFAHYKYTGINLIEEINALDPDLVIDVGCGHNRFKGHIQNLIGFDQQSFPFADIVANIEDIEFREGSADVVLALGSIQFGSRDLVRLHFAKIAKWVKPGGFVVMRTFRSSTTPYSLEDVHYIWTDKDIVDIGAEQGLSVIKGPFVENIVDSNNTVTSTRTAWWYQKPGTLEKYKIDPLSCKVLQR